MNYPRVLIVVMGRINKADNANNGLLLRNIFGNWPTEKLAQIYSGGSNGDQGFYGRYYCIGAEERRFGNLFFRFKPEVQNDNYQTDAVMGKTNKIRTIGKIFNYFGKHLLIDSGLYELIFQPKISKQIQYWVEEFKPEIIFCQGYNLAFTWLPMMIAKRFHIPIVYYPTDDWPANLYRAGHSGASIFSLLARIAVVNSSHKLVQESKCLLAFNHFMKVEYLKRYGQDFSVLMHGDDFKRIEAIPPLRLVEPTTCWIVCTGDFDQHRLPLIADLNQACEVLNFRGYNVHATIFAVNPIPEMLTNYLKYVEYSACPLDDGLQAVMRGADILFLPERFDKTKKLIRMSISTKAHMFMFAGKPIVVYSAPETGITRYAKEEGWAAVVERRDPILLAQTFERLIYDGEEQRQITASARQTALKNHHLPTIQNAFSEKLIELRNYIPIIK